MNGFDIFLEQAERIRQRVGGFEATAATSSREMQQSLLEAIEELHVSIEELRVAHEELQAY
ncbi:MAG: hypothetical protein ACRDIB_20140, partial [Ardenticatenaceae bacterium]